jgi:hypothetical protein
MKHITRWQPDTCECIIDYEWDDTIHPITYTQKQIVKQCSLHSSIKTESILDTIIIENAKKNKVINKIMEENPEVIEQTTWKYQKDGVLEITIDHSFNKQALETWISDNVDKTTIITTK